MIELRNVQKSFGEQAVLRGIDLRIADGETVAIIGQSGCGKSVLLKLLIGLLRPDAGEVIIDDVQIGRASERDLHAVRVNIGFLFQSAALFDSMNVEDNITLGLREHGVRDVNRLRQIAEDKLRLVGLTNVLHKMPSELSGGMRKRVGLARALATDPRYLFYDEPTTGLDPVTSDQIDQLIADITARLNVTSLIITHDMFTVEQIAKRVVFLYDGKIRFDGTPLALSASDDPVLHEFLERYTIKPSDTIKH
jgi:phospholipid/cholesterol/gamma-HCH transport system ATP-binding protein